MRINFCLPPARLAGGPLAIMEYANGLLKRGHKVTITTYPMSFWPNDWYEAGVPFPWYDFKGEYIITDDREYRSNLEKVKDFLLDFGGDRQRKIRAGYPGEIEELAIVLSLIAAFPDCDINIATIWLSAFAVYFSRKGKPVYFMQHYEEVFERHDFNRVLKLLSIRNTYELPMYKIANSSWLQRQIYEKYGQKVPFSLNAIDINEFSPTNKWSEKDGVIRILSYCDEREWKGFADIAQVMAKLYEEFPGKIEWHAFGKEHSRIKSDNKIAPYYIHTGLSFKELGRLYAASDIAVSASWYESFPLPPLEAMASGTAVVTTIYGTEDYCFNGRNSICVPPRDITAMYRAIKELIEAPDLRVKLAREGMETAKGFSWEKAIDVREQMLYDIYENRIEYNRFDPISTGFVDGCGIDFTQLPKDLEKKYSEGSYIKQDNRYFLIQNRCKRLIADPMLLSALSEEQVIEVDEIEGMRIPMGFTIWAKEDI